MRSGFQHAVVIVGFAICVNQAVALDLDAAFSPLAPNTWLEVSDSKLNDDPAKANPNPVPVGDFDSIVTA